MLLGRRALWISGVLAALLGFAFQGTRGIYDTTESRYSLCAREMADSGNWFEPTLGGRPHWTKPPLAYWTIAAGIRILGRNPWGARFANAAVFSATALLVGALGTAIWDAQAGALSGIVYATSIYPALVAWTINTDTLLAFWETLAALCFCMAEWGSASRNSRLWMLGLWAALGLGFFTKGPPALIPLVPIVLYRLGDPARRRKPKLVDAAGIALFLLLGCSWYVVEGLRHPGLLRSLLQDEVAGRVFTRMHGRGTEWYYPFKVYVPALFLGGGPWALWLFDGARRRGLWNPRSWRALARARGPSWFLFLWVAVPLVVFSLAQSRMPTYVLPLYPAVALAIAGEVRARWNRGVVCQRTCLTAGAAFAIVFAVKASPLYLPPPARDMTALWRLVREDDAAGRMLVFYEVERGWGLDFHASKPPIRTFGGEPQVPGGLTIEGFLDDWVSRGRTEASGAALIARTGDKARLLEALAARGISPVSSLSTEHWFVARVGPSSWDRGPGVLPKR